MGYILRQVGDNGPVEGDGEVLFLQPHGGCAIETDRAVELFSVCESLGQQRRGFVDIFGDDDRKMGGLAEVAIVGQVVAVGEHHDFIGVRRLIPVANRLRGRAAR